MFERLLNRIRSKILKREYVMTLHADEEMRDDSFTVYDIEEIILSGSIQERQKDKHTGEWKYRISGDTTSGRQGEVIVKLGQTGKVVVITVYTC